jgi:hypothetical protein
LRSQPAGCADRIDPSRVTNVGITPTQVARLEGLASADVETLVAEPDFKALVDGYNTLHAMPEEEQRRILTQLVWLS